MGTTTRTVTTDKTNQLYYYIKSSGVVFTLSISMREWKF